MKSRNELNRQKGYILFHDEHILFCDDNDYFIDNNYFSDLIKFIMHHNMLMKAVTPAADFGTRFLPATKAKSNEILSVYDKPIIQYVIDKAIVSGIDDILIITTEKSTYPHYIKIY